MVEHQYLCLFIDFMHEETEIGKGDHFWLPKSVQGTDFGDQFWQGDRNFLYRPLTFILTAVADGSIEAMRVTSLV